MCKFLIVILYFNTGLSGISFIVSVEMTFCLRCLVYLHMEVWGGAKWSIIIVSLHITVSLHYCKDQRAVLRKGVVEAKVIITQKTQLLQANSSTIKV